MGSRWDEVKRELGINLRAGFQARRDPGGANYSNIRDRAAEIRDEKNARAARLRLEQQTAYWEQKLGGGKRGTIKSVFKPDLGYTDIYYNGVGKPDGPGHGHIRVFEDGTETIVREPYDPTGGHPAKREATLMDDWLNDRREPGN
ncbi:hypothetical protein EK0264_04150 [Epidermidibacterium keratini]|uniref:Uncharacterized protein n=1 Tax=Epidermidibacterium keratini TaxID=1891644 RepID=A0A7L4YLY2_9ACTN|nr:hypothetical protein [Epidermidibacterium keratini]QHB99556.1 hypothetical protein EK0264_04150 [Epidermidibacterium keratini]